MDSLQHIGFGDAKLPKLIRRLFRQQVRHILTQIISFVDMISRCIRLRASWLDKQRDKRKRDDDLIAVTHRCAATVEFSVSFLILSWQLLVFTRYYAAYVIFKAYTNAFFS